MPPYVVSDLNSLEYNSYFQHYIDLGADYNLLEGFQLSHKSCLEFLNSIPEEHYEYRYAKDKWSIKEIIQHLIDTEMIFIYRALRISRGDKTSLPGFDENQYAKASMANNKSKTKLLEDLKTLRNQTIALFSGFDSKMLMQIGTASNSEISVRAIGFIIVGHETHHCNIIKSRYLEQ